MSRFYLVGIPVALLFFALILRPPITLATPSPYSTMWSVGIGTDISQPEFLAEAVQANPMYIFSNPYYEISRLSRSRITELHTQLPSTKVFLHLFCCNLFDQNKLQQAGSPIAKVAFSTQNTQSEFTNMWNNHRSAFLKDASGEYVYNIIPHTTNLWLDAGQSYLMDTENSAYQNLLYDRFKYFVTEVGFDGVYLDLMLPGFPITHYSSRPMINGQLMSYEQGKTKLIALSRALQEKRRNDPDPRIRNAFIFTNSVGGGEGQFYSNSELIQYNLDLQTQGVQIENPFQNFPNLSSEEWLETTELIKGITGIRNNTMRGWINFHHRDGVPTLQVCNQQSLFTYASYLLANQSPHFAFMFLCKIQDPTLPERRIFASENLTKIDLGSALNQYQQLNSDLYLREFARGLVLVNPTDSAHNYKPKVDLQDAYSSTTYPKNLSISLPAKTGLVLLKNPSSLPGDFNSDGRVNMLDYSTLLAGYGSTYTMLEYNQFIGHYSP